MGNNEDKEKHIRRRKNHIAKDLRTKKYAPRVIKEEIYDRNKIKEFDRNVIIVDDD